jgi:hypothetical protein
LAEIGKEVRRNGYAFRPRKAMLTILGDSGLDEWPGFAASWEDLGQDNYMGDGGRYRRRRFAAFAIHGEKIIREPHQPHYQSRDYNRLNGGVLRWFEPVRDVVATHTLTLRTFGICTRIFDELTFKPAGLKVWHVEMHQFRIEANKAYSGHPTPEGIHRDSVEWVCVVLVNRRNVSSGVTHIYSRGEPLGAFTLTDSLDTVFIDDARVLHGVTPIHAQDSTLEAFRDVLVFTFRERGKESNLPPD